MITGAQCGTARKLLRWTRQRLADEARLSIGTVANLETGQSNLRLPNLFAVRRALEAAGIIFTQETSENPGVRLRKGAR